MGSSVVRNLIGILALIILSFLIGITAAGSTKSAVMVIVAVAGIVGIIAMGKHVWVTLFLLPPVCILLPKIGGFISLSYTLYAAVLCYWVILRFLGYVHFTWRKLIIGDIFVFAFVLLMAISFYRHPVDIGYLGTLFNYHVKYVGGAPFVACICFLTFYLCFSCIPFDKHILLTVFKWRLILLLICQLALGIIELRGTNVESQRFGMFKSFGHTLFIAAFCSAPFIKLITSPTAILCFILSLLSALLSGFRVCLANLGIIAITAIIVKKEYYIVPLAILTSVVSLGLLSTSGALTHMPYTVQRVLSGIPGLKVQENVRVSSSSSTDWRVEMWKWALDPRTGHIKNYIFGDGFGIDASYLSRAERSIKRGSISDGDQVLFSKSRTWHNNFIYTLQALGWTGVILTICYHIYIFFIAYKINSALRNTAYFKYSMLFTYSFAWNVISFLFMDSNTNTFFLYHLPIFVYLKVFHQIAIEEGRITPWQKRQKYEPLLIQQQKASELQTELMSRRDTSILFQGKRIGYNGS